MIKSIILAIILAESGFDPNAVSETKALGLMQIMPIGLLEATLQCNIPDDPDLFNPETNILVGSCLYNYYRRQSNSTVEALIMYHGGYAARDKFRKGVSAGPRTERYVNLVLHYKELFKNEEINISVYCNKYPRLPNTICKGIRTPKK